MPFVSTPSRGGGEQGKITAMRMPVIALDVAAVWTFTQTRDPDREFKQMADLLTFIIASDQ